MKNKRCCRCEHVFPKNAQYFYRGKNYKDGLSPHCKICSKDQYTLNKDIYNKNKRNTYQINPEKYRNRAQTHKNKNREEINLKRRLHICNASEEERIYFRTKRKGYYYNSHNRIILYKRNRRKTNINFKLKDNLRRRINDAIKNNYKSDNTMRLIGCSIDFLKKYLENQFKQGMNWYNHGINGWHIDHIKPCNSFGLSKPEQQKECFYYTNLQPLWAKDNLSKGDKYECNTI